MGRSRQLAMAGLLVLAAGWLVACSVAPAPPVPTFVPRVTPTPQRGEVYTVERGTLSEVLETRGRVVASQEELLSFSLNGFLKSVDVQAGDPVQAGQVIAEIDAVDLEDKLLEGEYRLQVAKGGLATAEARRDTLQLQIETLSARIEALSARIEALIAQTEQQQALDGYEVAAAQGEREVARAGVDACEAQLPWMEEAIPQAEARLRRAEFRYEEVQYGWEEHPKTGEPVPMPYHTAILNEYEAAQRGLAQTKADLAGQKASCKGLKSTVDRRRTEVNYYTKVQGLEVRRLEAERAGLEAERDGLEADKSRLGKEKEINELTIQTSEHEVRYRQTVVERFDERLAHTQLEAPFDGVIVSVEKQVGEELEPYEPLGAIADPSVFRVESTVLEEEILKVALGQLAVITLDAYAASPFQGTVTEIGTSPIVWQGKNAYTVYVDFVDPDQVPASIRMGADLGIEVMELADVLLVPESAVARQGARAFVTRVNSDGSAEQVEVSVGISDGEWTEVLAGLDEGHRIQIP